MTTNDSFASPSDKIKKSVDKVLQYNLDLKSNVEKIKEKAGKYARKDLNTNIILENKLA